jgi:hypothetical protein
MYYDLTTAPELDRIVRASGVRGKKGTVTVREWRGPQRMNSYWDGGSKDEYALVELGTLKVWTVPDSHPHFDRKPNGDRCGILELRELPEGTCLVSGGVFCGKPATITLHFRPENLALLLPSPDATALSAQALSALRILRSIRGGFRLGEFQRAGLGRYGGDNPAVLELVAAGMVTVNKAGSVSITTAGRNRA